MRRSTMPHLELARHASLALSQFGLQSRAFERAVGETQRMVGDNRGETANPEVLRRRLQGSIGGELISIILSEQHESRNSLLKSLQEEMEALRSRRASQRPPVSIRLLKLQAMSDFARTHLPPRVALPTRIRAVPSEAESKLLNRPRP